MAFTASMADATNHNQMEILEGKGLTFHVKGEILDILVVITSDPENKEKIMVLQTVPGDCRSVVFFNPDGSVDGPGGKQMFPPI